MSKANISLMTLTVIATAAIVANRFVTLAGAPCAAAALPLGVARSDGAIGDPIPVDTIGTAVVEAGGIITAGAAIMVTTDGKALAHDLDGDKHAVGRALSASGADGDLIEVLLTPGSGLLVTAV